MEMETRPYVAWDLMNSFMIDVFKCYGVPAEDAAISSSTSRMRSLASFSSI